MRFIIVTDIFGQAEHISMLRSALVARGVAPKVIDPYKGVSRIFQNEEQAYMAFLDECGHSNYAAQVRAELEATDGRVVIVGFSAGASAAWNAIDGRYGDKIVHFVGFYPSQIRNDLHVDPSCPVTFIFPSQEDHFDIDEVIDAVSGLKKVVCVRSDLHHGFMNPLSRNYSETGAQAFSKAIDQAGRLADVDSQRRLFQQALPAKNAGRPTATS